MRRTLAVPSWIRAAAAAASLIAFATYCSGDSLVVPPDNTVANITLDPVAATIRVGATQQLTAVGSNKGGVPITNGVQFSSSDAAIATVSSQGLVRGLKPGTATITAQGGTAQKTAVITVIPGLAASITKVAGDAQLAQIQTAVAIAPSVLVKDSAGFAVPGATVTFTVQTGGGSTAGSAVVTNASGVATIGAWVLGAQTGANSLVVTVTPATSAISATFLATATPKVAGPPASITINAGDAQTGYVGTAVPIAPSVLVRDAGGMVVPNAAVTFAVTSGGGTLAGASAFTNTAGIASLTSWTLGSTLGAQTITATVGSLAPVTFTATATPVPQPPTHLFIATNPGNGIVGAPFGIQPVIQVRDIGGNVVSNATNPVTATISFGGRLTGTFTVNAVAGIATFTDLTPLDLGAYTIQFESPGLAPASVTVQVGNGGILAVAVPTQFTAVSAGADPTAQTVAITNSGTGAPISGLAVSPVNYLSSPVTGWLTASVSSITTPSTLILQPHTAGLQPGTYNAQVTVSGTGVQPVVVDISFVVTPQDPAALVITTQPSGGTSTTILATQPVIEIRDASNVRVNGASVQVGVSVASGPGTLSGQTLVTSQNGIATFTSLKLTTPGTYTLLFALPGVPPVISAPFTVTP